MIRWVQVVQYVGCVEDGGGVVRRSRWQCSMRQLTCGVTDKPQPRLTSLANIEDFSPSAAKNLLDNDNEATACAAYHNEGQSQTFLRHETEPD